jgi:hypothetical protein
VRDGWTPKLPRFVNDTRLFCGSQGQREGWRVDEGMDWRRARTADGLPAFHARRRIFMGGHGVIASLALPG